MKSVTEIPGRPDTLILMRYRIGLGALVLLVAAAVVYYTVSGPSPGTGTSAGTGHAASSDALLPAAARVAAPEFTGIDTWINSKPLTISGLRGKVVLIDFWTFSCINCVRTLPHLSALYNRYSSKGFVIVGVHSPEFDFEKNLTNVSNAVKRLHVTWPVAVDSEMATWSTWGNNVWPAEYLLDQQGRVAYVNPGEGNYDVTAGAVQTLLGAQAQSVTASAIPVSDSNSITPEIYVGSNRGQNYGLSNGENYSAVGSATTYPDAQPQNRDHVLLTGTWTNNGDYMTAGASAHVKLRWHALAIYVVAGSSVGQVNVPVNIDGTGVKPYQRGSSLSSSSTLTVNRNDLYAIAGNFDPGSHIIDLTVPRGFEIFTFTFG
jgi:thiol-disulfide isomerase/thioredoxin